MNFFTAEIVIEVNVEKLPSQLAKAKEKITKYVRDVEKSFKKQVDITKASKIISATVDSLKEMGKALVKTVTDIGLKVGLLVWSFTKLGFTLRTALNITKYIFAFDLLISAAGHSGETIKNVVAVTKKLYRGTYDFFRMLLGFTKEAEVATKRWRSEHFVCVEEMKEGIKERAGTVKLETEYLEKQNAVLKERVQIEKALSETGGLIRPGVGIRSKLLAEKYQVKEMRDVYEEVWKMQRRFEEQMRRTGETAHDVSGVIVIAYGKIFNAITGVFKGIVDTVETMWEKVFRVTKLRVLGIVASLSGMYYKVTQAAMDVEDALSFAEKGPTRRSLQRLREAIEGIAAAFGKPFLNSIRVISSAIAEWLENSRERFARWSEKLNVYIDYIRAGFVAWVKYLQTDWRGGIQVAIDIIVELFKGLGESIVTILAAAGKKAGLALVKGLVGGIAGAAASETERATGFLESILKKLMKSSEGAWKRLGRFTGVPGGRDPMLPFQPGTQLGGRTEETEAEALSKRLMRIARERAENIKKLFEGMPTWSPPPDKVIADAEISSKAIMDADTAMAEHRRMLLEQGGTQSEMEYRLDLDRITRRMEAQTQAAREIEEVWKEMEDKRIEREWHAMRAPIIEADKLAREISERNKRIAEDYASATANAWTDAFMKMAMEGKKFGDAMKDMFRELLAMIMRIYIYKMVAEPIAYGMMGLPIPGAQHGGYVEKTGLAIIHKGETYSGVGNSGGGGITINVNNVPEDYTISEAEEYMFGDQRVIDISMQAAEGNGQYRRAHGIGR